MQWPCGAMNSKGLASLSPATLGKGTAQQWHEPDRSAHWRSGCQNFWSALRGRLCLSVSAMTLKDIVELGKFMAWQLAFSLLFFNTIYFVAHGLAWLLNKLFVKRPPED